MAKTVVDDGAVAEMPATAVVTETVAPIVETKAGKPAVRKAKPTVAPAPAPAPAPKVEAVATPVAPTKKTVATKPAAKAPVVKAPVAAPKPKSVKPEKPAAAAPVAPKATPIKKEARTMTTATTEMTEKFQTAIKDASDKAKLAFEKSQASLGEMGAFSKGNIEALVEMTKILTTGLQTLSQGFMTESKTTLETLGAEFKDLAASKSPSELLEKQSVLLRKHFDAAVATSSKNSEAVLKLANEAFQPISTRVSLAVEKVKKAA